MFATVKKRSLYFNCIVTHHSEEKGTLKYFKELGENSEVDRETALRRGYVEKTGAVLPPYARQPALSVSTSVRRRRLR